MSSIPPSADMQDYLESLMRAGQDAMKQFDDALVSATGCKLGGAFFGAVAPSSRILRSCQTAGKDVPAGTMAMVSSSDFVRVSEMATAIATLNRQRHRHHAEGSPLPRREQWARQG